MCNICDESNPLSTYVFCGLNCEESGLGNITVYPQKSYYLKGEKVHAWFIEGTNPGDTFPVNGNTSHSATAMLMDKVFLIITDPEGRCYTDHVNYQKSSKGGIAKIVSNLLYSESPFAPYPLGWNPCPYTSTHPNEFYSIEHISACLQCNAVELEPVTCLNSIFLHWEVSSNGDDWIPVPLPFPVNLTVYMNYFGPFDPANDPGNIHVANGCTSLYVRPVFKLSCAFCSQECPPSGFGLEGRDVIIDMYENPDVKWHNIQMYPGPAPACSMYVTNQQNHPRTYTKENLLPFNKLQCNHGSLDYPHDGWAVEDGIAECYAEVEQAYSGTISITCVYRCPKKNAVLTASSITSKHLLGKAFDFDQLSSEANWDVANTAYQLNPNWEILLYENGGREKFFPGYDASHTFSRERI